MLTSLYWRFSEMTTVRQCFLLIIYFGLFHDRIVVADDKRFILNSPDPYQMELAIRNLNNIITGMQTDIIDLIHEIKQKDYQIGNLTAIVNSVQQKENVPIQGCQTGLFEAKTGNITEYKYGVPVLLNDQYEHFTFSPPFTNTPKIVWGTTTLDFKTDDTNLRFRSDVLSLTQYGFTMRFIIWSTSEGFKAWIQWMACP